ncbi:MAG: hypothetical protein HOE82_05640 [Gammaproteobacteria bacterium]|nr:hypothetical protein [Gammaproteobacteria bacterium]
MLKELDMNLSKVKNDYGREIAIVVRSVENLDRMLGLFDLSDETNLKNGEALA